MHVDPDIPEAHALRGWYDAAPSDQKFQSHTGSMPSGGGVAFDRAEIRNLNDVKVSELGMFDKPDYFSARATVMHIKSDNISYPACPTQGCGKKVLQMGDSWRCEKCDKSYPKPEYRYVAAVKIACPGSLTEALLFHLHRYTVAMAVSDYSGQAWFQGFNDVGQLMFGMSADELVDIKVREASADMNRSISVSISNITRAHQRPQERDDVKYNQVMDQTIGTTYNFACRARQDTYNVCQASSRRWCER